MRGDLAIRSNEVGAGGEKGILWGGSKNTWKLKKLARSRGRFVSWNVFLQGWWSLGESNS